jgi:hypothetical protein
MLIQHLAIRTKMRLLVVIKRNSYLQLEIFLNKGNAI